MALVQPCRARLLAHRPRRTASARPYESVAVGRILIRRPRSIAQRARQCGEKSCHAAPEIFIAASGSAAERQRAAAALPMGKDGTQPAKENERRALSDPVEWMWYPSTD